MTDISISDNERISLSDVDRKIEQLSYYIKRVNQRMSAIKNFSKNSTTADNKKFISKFKKTHESAKIRINR
tara:strand:- start:7267 stop:7479 length:213 start_codon:yes stop_codon:yes gene_type:complete